MLRNCLMGMLATIGCVFILMGFWNWGKEGYHLDRLWFYKNTFAMHPLHFAVLGLAILVFALFDIWLNKSK